MRLRQLLKFGSFLASVMLISLILARQGNLARAVSGTDWKPGRIIDDAIFSNSMSMSAAQIQQFLDIKVPVCDRWRTSSNPSYQPPYTCLKEYQENTSTGESNYGRFNPDGTPLQISGGKTAAQIIWEEAQNYSINPQVLLTMLQKEQSLITDDWPWLIQYQKAMGQSCPDTAPCDPAFAGFYNQVSGAAWQLRHYINNPQYFNYRAAVTRYVLYNPNSSCGGTNVFIENAATAALYNYTPYQPNQAALNNLYGTGDSCSAYGNRNFWRLFNDWFGSSTSTDSLFSINVLSVPPSTASKGESVSYTLSVTNRLAYTVSLDAVGVIGRLGSIDSSVNRDMGWVGPITLAPGSSQQFTFTTVVQDVGQLYYYPSIVYSGQYVHYGSARALVNTHEPNFEITSPLTISPISPIAGQVVTVSATIKNNESKPIRIDAIGVPIRFYSTYSYDTAWQTPTGSTIAPGASITVSGSKLFDKTGPYNAWLSWNLSGMYTTLSTTQTVNVTPAIPSFSLTYLETPNQSPALGEEIAVKFKLKNNLPVASSLDAIGVVGRYSNPYSGVNRDFGWVGPDTFAPGEEKTYTTFVSTVSELNTFYSWVAIRAGNKYTHFNNWGFKMTPHRPNISVISPLLVNNGNAVVRGQSVPFSVTIKNNEPRSIRYDATGIPVKYFGVYSYDTAWMGPGILAPSGQPGDTVTLYGSTTLDKSGPYTAWASFMFSGIYTSLSTPVIVHVD